jgi:Flp/Fap pilin component
VKRRKHSETKEREMTLLLRFVKNEKGTTAIEYALIAVGVFGSDPSVRAVGGLRRVGPV